VVNDSQPLSDNSSILSKQPLPDALAPGPARSARAGRIRISLYRLFVPGCLFAPALLAALSLEGCREHDGKAATGAPAGPGGGAAPQAVSVLTVKPETLPVTSEWVASLDGFVNAQVRPQVTGYLIKRAYDEGAAVKKDQVLFEIDSRPFHNAMAQAQATLAKARADLGRAQRDKARDTPLAKERAIPQSQLDNDVQSELAALAAEKAAEASIESAQLNLSFTKVRSLIAGVAAIATAQIGDLVTPASLLTTVSQVDPIKANFSLSEQEYLRAARQLNQVAKHQPWQAGTQLKLFLADNSEYDQPGSFLAADRQIDPRTGTIRISATFPNPDNILRPGLYGRVRAETSVVENALLVPQRAVTEMQGAAQVRVVGPDNKISLRNVTLGARAGNRWVVEKGLAAGDSVVLDGPQLRDGTPVTPTPMAPSAQNNPAENPASAKPPAAKNAAAAATPVNTAGATATPRGE
jgi:RND family efflux transporter MFP subunit